MSKAGNKDVVSRLKYILEEKEAQGEKWSLRELAHKAGLKPETVRRLYHDKTVQYHRHSIAAICDTLNVEISELLELVDKKVD